MPASFFFYDLETSGFEPKYARIMQFAGQRTDAELNPIGEPVNQLIKLTPDVLPDPDAVLVTGITPQATLADGISEAEFLKIFNKEICASDTTFVGYNSIRFDDEFMRYLHYRNFYDAYEWQWCDGCSRWDLLDVVRMARALRPDGINWPFNADGSQSNRLEFITKVNGLDHENAHDALSDVQATVAVAKLIKTRQPKLFQYLFDLRDKKKVAALVESRQPFVYTSGAYDSEFGKTAVAVMIAAHPAQSGAALVYDLRYNPKALAELAAKDIAKRLAWAPRGTPRELFPVKVMRFNRCPAAAPLSVLDDASQQRLKLDMHVVEANCKQLAAMPEFIERVVNAFADAGKKREQSSLIADEQTVDGQLYDGFLGDQDRRVLANVRLTEPAGLSDLRVKLKDVRLQTLLPLYKARNYPETLTSEEREAWDNFCRHRLMDGGSKSRLAAYMDRLSVLAETSGLTQNQKYLLQELQLYAESVMPAEQFV